MPKVSVIVPVYGVEKYIERCARSLFEQTLDDIELIFVDDCTPDHSIEILNAIIEEYRLRFAEMNYTVRIERMPTNSGLPAVRRHGIQLATGDYIIHCDSDDWVDRDMYRMMYESVLNSHSDIVFCDYYISDGENDEIQNNHYDLDTDTLIKGFLRRKYSWSLWNKLVKRELYTGDIEYPKNNMGEDMALVFQLVSMSKSFSYVEIPLYYYYHNPSSITKAVKNSDSLMKLFYQDLTNAKIVLNLIENLPNNQTYNKSIIVFCYYIRDQFVGVCKSKEYRRSWVNSFSKIKYRSLLSNDKGIKYRIKYLLVILGLRFAL